ncbi:MAG: VWA domain-containing protein [Bacteroidia bacterium]|nr:VWA domain-containing protein [Bacteroidia bacterium]
MSSWFGIDYFAQPEALLLLLLGPLYIFWYRRYYRRQRLVVRLSYDPDKLQAPKYQIAWLRLLPRIFQLTGIAFFIFALARPQHSQQVTEQQDLGADVIIVLDVSRSMENKDVPPSRFMIAKSAIRAMIETRKSERFGVVVFGPTALSMAPLTFDHDFLLGILDKAKSNLLPGEGSALGPALGVALNRLKESDATSKIIIVFSDGGANGGDLDPLSASRLAAASGIPIHCVGIAENGQQQNLALLSQVASRSGGAFVLANSRTQLEQLWNELEPGQPPRQQAREFRVSEDMYPIFLQIGIILLVISYLLMLTSIYNPLEQ